MAKCSNCGKQLSCGCQKRTASNGVSACSNCIGGLEKSLKPQKTITTTSTAQQRPWGANRYNNK
jgi:hypothetical protein